MGCHNPGRQCATILLVLMSTAFAINSDAAQTGTVTILITFDSGNVVTRPDNCKPLLTGPNGNTPTSDVRMASGGLRAEFVDPIPYGALLTGVSLTVYAGNANPPGALLQAAMRPLGGEQALPLGSVQPVFATMPPCDTPGNLDPVGFSQQFATGPPAPSPPQTTFYNYGFYNFIELTNASVGDAGVWYSGTLTLSYALRPLADVNIWNDDGKAAFALSENTTNSAPHNINIPVGSTFSVRLVYPRWAITQGDVAAIYQAAISATIDPEIDVVIDRSVLLPNTCFFTFDSAQPTSTQMFHAVHEGHQDLNVAPVDTSLPPIAFTVNVYAPDQLGWTNYHHEFDSLLVQRAHQTGLPPTFLKAEAAHESDQTFSPVTFRYEPLTTDWDLNHSNRLTIPKYERNALDTGANVVRPDDTAFRTDFFIHDPALGTAPTANCRQITPDDTGITVAQIFDANDGDPALSHPCSGATRQNWFANLGNRARRVAITTNVQTALGYLAQTGLSASYGIFQTLLLTATDDNWHTADQRLAPRTIVDTSQNNVNRTSSVFFGPHYFAELLIALEGDPYPSFANQQEWITDLRQIQARYNASSTYPAKVWRFLTGSQYYNDVAPVLRSIF